MVRELQLFILHIRRFFITYNCNSTRCLSKHFYTTRTTFGKALKNIFIFYYHKFLFHHSGLVLFLLLFSKIRYIPNGASDMHFNWQSIIFNFIDVLLSVSNHFAGQISCAIFCQRICIC